LQHAFVSVMLQIAANDIIERMFY